MAAEKKIETRPVHHLLPEETWQHLKAAHKEIHQSFESLLPPGFVEHRRAARREMLLAARSLIDAAIERTDKK